MGAKQSQEMKKAQKLIVEKGLTVREAARQVGISTPAIYMSSWYKEFKACRAKQSK